MTLESFFQKNPVGAVALSGGVDSALLFCEAVKHCRHTAAYFVQTAFQPAFERRDAREIATQTGGELHVLELDILSYPAVADNPGDRCYYCKQAIFSAICSAARADGFPLVFDGSNASDDAGDRPGMRALSELGVCSPLRECGLVKQDVRRLARAAGLHVWDKPSYACLATRIPTGMAITPAHLARVERGETALAAMGFTDFRLRLRPTAALLQVREEQMEMAEQLLPAIRARLASDFPTVNLDPAPRANRET